MINYVMGGTNGFEEATAFYDVLPGAMGATRVYFICYKQKVLAS